MGDSNNDIALAPLIREYLSYLNEHYCMEECSVYFSDTKKAEHFVKELRNLFESFATQDEALINKNAQAFASEASSSHIPYIIINNLVETFKNSMIAILLKQSDNEQVELFLHLTLKVEKAVAQHYLTDEVANFLKHNQIRIESIHEIVEENIMHLYEAHLKWLNTLGEALINLDAVKLPQLHPDLCTLGKWLKDEGREVITTQERFDTLDRVHRNLHLIAKRAELVMQTEPINYHYLMMLLKNADMFSLTIGLELAIINNVEYIKRSSKDPLTGTLNRQLFYSIYRNQFDIAKAVDKSFGVIMTDIDDFKQINDNYGHTAGDTVLQAFSEILLNETRKSDFVIRYGGEEFIIILPITTIDETMLVARKLQEVTEAREIGTTRGPLKITASFGVTCITPQDNEIPTQERLKRLVEEVDVKLYMAKQCGNNQVV